MQSTFLDAPTAIGPRGGCASARPEVEPLPDHFFTASGRLRHGRATLDILLTGALEPREKLFVFLLKANDLDGRGACLFNDEIALATGIPTTGKDEGRGQISRLIRDVVAKVGISVERVSPRVHLSGRRFHLPQEPTRSDKRPRVFPGPEVDSAPGGPGTSGAMLRRIPDKTRRPGRQRDNNHW